MMSRCPFVLCIIKNFLQKEKMFWVVMDDNVRRLGEELVFETRQPEPKLNL